VKGAAGTRCGISGAGTGRAIVCSVYLGAESLGKFFKTGWRISR
jgi:hypothetical protein